ncbi:hypothetical protein ACFL0S_06070 [Thermodesulfobacteriota bacterium]
MNKAIENEEPRPTTAEAQEPNGDSHPEKSPSDNTIPSDGGDVKEEHNIWYTCWQHITNQARMFVQDTEGNRKKHRECRYQIYPPHFSHDPTDKNKGEPLRKGDLVIDLDDAEDPSRALTEAILVINHTEEVYGTPADAWRAWVSGGKGFHLLLDARWLGLEKASVLLPKYFKKVVVEELIVPLDLKTVDTSIYNMKSGKPLRRENIKRENGRYKVPITIEELLHEPSADLLALADKPRQIDDEPAEPAVVPGLLEKVQHWVGQVDDEINMPHDQRRTPEVMKRVLKDIKAPDCIGLILDDTSDADPSCRDFNRIAQTLTRFCLMKEMSLNESVELCRPFIEGYQHSSRLKTEKQRLDNFTARYRSMSANDAPFDCGYVRGLKIPGVGTGSGGCCQSCPAWRLPLAEVMKAFDDLEATDNLNVDDSDAWCKEIFDANPDDIKLGEMLKEVAKRLGAGKAAVKKVYKAYEAGVAHAAAEKEGPTDRKILYDSFHVKRAVRQAELALNKYKTDDDLECYMFGDVVSMVVLEEPSRAHAVDDANTTPPAIPIFKEYRQGTLKMRMETTIEFYEPDKKNKNNLGKQIVAPAEVLSGILNNPQSELLKVEGLLAAPCVRHDGSYIADAGYDERTGLYLYHSWSPDSLMNPDEVSQDRAHDLYRKIVKTLFSDTEFASPLDEAVAVAQLLTVIQRRVMDLAPGFNIKAFIQGTGKTTLERIIHLTVTGHEMPVYTHTVNTEEARKQMLSALIANPTMVVFDNVDDGMRIESSVVSKAVTNVKYTDRYLSESRMVTVPSNTVFSYTGNNTSLGSDLLRRFIDCRLVSSEAKPEQRDFKHTDVVSYVRSVRQEIIGLCLGLVGGHIKAGVQSAGVTASGFSMWDKMVRLPVLWSSGIDLIDAFDRGAAESNERNADKVLVRVLRNRFGIGERFTAKDVVEAVRPGDRGRINTDCDISVAIDGCADRYDLSRPNSVGRILEMRVGRTTLEGTIIFKKVGGTNHYWVEIEEMI